MSADKTGEQELTSEGPTQEDGSGFATRTRRAAAVQAQALRPSPRPAGAAAAAQRVAALAADDAAAACDVDNVADGDDVWTGLNFRQDVCSDRYYKTLFAITQNALGLHYRQQNLNTNIEDLNDLVIIVFATCN